jgi:hypothetical protein
MSRAASPAPRRPARPRLGGAVGVLVALTLTASAAACQSSSPTSAAARGTTPDGSAIAAAAPGVEATEPPPSTTTTTKPLRRVTIAGSGDILLHMPVQRQGAANAGGKGYDFAPMFREVKDEISAADVAICHQETPISANNTALTGYPVFNAPTEIAAALKGAGFDGCDTASNHSIDKGLAGVIATGDVMDAAGLKHTGSFRTADEAVDGGGVLYDAKGVSVGHLAYTYGTNGFPLPAPWVLNINNAAKMLADAKALKARGAQIVVMSVHWGNEYQTAPTPDQVALAHELLSSPDVDLILGDHVHVVQPMEKFNDKYVIYGMGNFLSNQSPESDRTLLPSTQDGGLYTYTFEEKPEGGFRAVEADYTPTYVHRPDYVITKTSPTVQPQSFLRTVKAINSLGAGSNDAQPTTGPVPAEAAGPTTTTTTVGTTTSAPKASSTTVPKTITTAPKTTTTKRSP